MSNSLASSRCSVASLTRTHTKMNSDTLSVKSYKYKGWYFTPWDSYLMPSRRLIVEICNEISTGYSTLGEWLKRKRQNFEEILETCPDDIRNLEQGSTRVDLGNDHCGFSRCHRLIPHGAYFDIDLDHQVLDINGVPTFHLENMPPEDLFLEGISFDESGVCTRHFDNISDHMFRMDILPAPPVDDNVLQFYRIYVQEDAPCIVNNLLSLSETVSTLDQVCVHERNAYLHIFKEQYTTRVCSSYNLLDAMKEFIYSPDMTAMQTRDCAWAFNLTALALLPVSHRFLKPEVETMEQPSYGQHRPVWWPRKHICVLLATAHLMHIESRNVAIVQVVQEITRRNNSQDIIYGVVFSIFQCVLVRVDRNNDNMFTHTDVLPYWPDFSSSTTSWTSTAGLEALVRLGNLAAEDDEDFFYNFIYPCRKAEEKTSETSATAPTIQVGGPHLSQDTLNCIAEHIYDPRTLATFALASHSTMAAALPRLRLPSCLSYNGDACFILQRKLHTPDSAEAAFCALAEGGPLSVTLGNKPLGFLTPERPYQLFCADIPIVILALYERISPPRVYLTVEQPEHT